MASAEGWNPSNRGSIIKELASRVPLPSKNTRTETNSVLNCFPVGTPTLFGLVDIEEGELEDESEELIASVAVVAALAGVQAQEGLKKKEAQPSKETAFEALISSVRVVVVAPTKTLAQAIFNIMLAFEDQPSPTISLLARDASLAEIKRELMLTQPEVLVTTPGKLHTMTVENEYIGMDSIEEIILAKAGPFIGNLPSVSQKFKKKTLKQSMLKDLILVVDHIDKQRKEQQLQGFIRFTAIESDQSLKVFAPPAQDMSSEAVLKKQLQRIFSHLLFGRETRIEKVSSEAAEKPGPLVGQKRTFSEATGGTASLGEFYESLDELALAYNAHLESQEQRRRHHVLTGFPDQATAGFDAPVLEVVRASDRPEDFLAAGWVSADVDLFAGRQFRYVQDPEASFIGNADQSVWKGEPSARQESPEEAPLPGLSATRPKQWGTEEFLAVREEMSSAYLAML